MRKLYNTFRYLLLIVVVSFCGCLGWAAAGEFADDIEFITLSANGWGIEARPNGSAEISRDRESNAVLDQASVPSGSVDFESLRRAIETELLNKESSQTDSGLRAFIFTKKSKPRPVIYGSIKNIEIWNQLITRLEPKLTYLFEDSFKKRVKEYPLRLERRNPPADSDMREVMARAPALPAGSVLKQPSPVVQTMQPSPVAQTPPAIAVDAKLITPPSVSQKTVVPAPIRERTFWLWYVGAALLLAAVALLVFRARRRSWGMSRRDR